MNCGYTIPQEDDLGVYPDLLAYPDAARGLKLGTTLHWLLVNAKTRPKHVNTIEALAGIGFPVDVDWERYVWEHQRLPALRVYQELYGDLRVPPSFIVPTGDKRWPIETWGFKLGYYANYIRCRGHRTLPLKHQEDLDHLNASWNLKVLTPAERLALLAPTLKVFHAKYVHIIMPFHFVVPEDQESDDKQANQVGDVWDESWPPKGRGETPGTTLHAFMKSASQRDKNPGIVEELSDIGFPVDVEWKQYVFERVPLAALSTYRALHGNCQVPQSFAVPTGDTRWPIETWGLKLGTHANNSHSSRRRSLRLEQLDALAAVGFP